MLRSKEKRVETKEEEKEEDDKVSTARSFVFI